MNPIVKMMKRYIKTPLKYTLPIVVVASVALASICGCTSPATTSPSPTTNPNGVTPFTADQLNTISNNFAHQLNITVQQPFYQNGTVDGYPYYQAVFTSLAGKYSVVYMKMIQTNNKTRALDETNATIQNYEHGAGSFVGSWVNTSTGGEWQGNGTSYYGNSPAVPAWAGIYYTDMNVYPNFNAVNPNVAVAQEWTTSVSTTAIVGPTATKTPAPLTQSQLDTITSEITSGTPVLVVVSGFTNSGTSGGYPYYRAEFQDANGTVFHDSVIQSNSQDNATIELAAQMAYFQSQGFTGGYQGQSWIGNMTNSSGTFGVGLRQESPPNPSPMQTNTIVDVTWYEII